VRALVSAEMRRLRFLLLQRFQVIAEILNAFAYGSFVIVV